MFFNLFFKRYGRSKWAPTTSHRWQGATLLEMLIVLVLIGVLAGAALKGWTLVQQGRLRKLGSQIQTYTHIINHYKESYMYLPGETGEKTLTKEGLAANSPNVLAWSVLSEAGMIEKPSHKTRSGALIPAPSVSGSCLSLVRDDSNDAARSGVWLLAGADTGDNNEGAAFTFSEAEFLAKSVYSSSSASEVRITAGTGASEEDCKEGSTKKACIVYFFVCP